MTANLMPVAPGARQGVLDTGGFRLTEAWYSADRVLARHAHQNAVLVFVLKGWVREHCTPGLAVCRPLSAFTLPAGAAHSETFSAPGARCLLVEVPDDRAGMIQMVSTLLAQPWYTCGPQVARLGLELYREFRQPDDVALLAIEGLVLQLSALAVRHAPRDADPREPPWLRRVQEIIHARFRHPLRIADLATDADVHPVYLARAFRKYYGCSPAECVRRLRVQAASEALAHSDVPLAQVALSAGFSDQSHLSRQFRQMVGMSPGRFRVEARECGASVTPAD